MSDTFLRKNSTISLGFHLQKKSIIVFLDFKNNFDVKTKTEQKKSVEVAGFDPAAF